MKGFKSLYFKLNSLYILNQKKLPQKLTYIKCKSVRDVYSAIKNMYVRGAPAIGVAAGFGVYLGIKDEKKCVYKKAKESIELLRKSRPTARNLFWVLERIEKVLEEKKSFSPEALKKEILKEAKVIYEWERKVSYLIGENGSRLIKKGDRILTICNAGALATVDWGTALSVIYIASKKKKEPKVYALETRPLLQGARLTCWELKREGIDTVLVCDSTAAKLMAENKIDKIIVGADRITLNGDTANKIGTLNLAILAKYFGIPFYVAAPFSTFDFSLKEGAQISIEERNKKEVLFINNKPIAPLDVKVYNPVFDVTPHSLITAFITEKGIIEKPFRKNIIKILKDVKN